MFIYFIQFYFYKVESLSVIEVGL